MELLLEIRPASTDDASAMVQVKKLTWPEEEIRLNQVKRVLDDPAHEVLVAEVQGRVAGFVDSFVTTAANGDLRWEVDLLAVHPDWRGRQLGQKMILACLKAGQERGAAFARALIQVENRASQISFERCGFQLVPKVLCLYVSPAKELFSTAAESDGHLLAVNTINYSGLWLEEDASESSLIVANAACWQKKCDLVGTLVIQANLSDNEKMNELGFTKVGDYQWWTLPFEANQDYS